MQARMLTAQHEREKKMVMYAITMSLALHIVFFTIFVILPEFRGSRPLDLQPIYISIEGGGGDGPAPLPTVTDTPQPATQGNPPAELQPATTKPSTPVENVYIPPPVQTTPVPSEYSTTKPDNTEKPVEPVENADNIKSFAPQFTKNPNATAKVEENVRNMQRAEQQTQQQQQQTQQAVTQTQTGTESVNSAIQQLRDKQAAQQAGTGSGGSGGGTGGGNGSGSGPGSGPGTGTGVGGPLSIYLGIIVPIIEKNWSFSPSLFGGTPSMEVVLEVTIMANGEITDIQFVRKSGDAYLDESAYRAMAKSSPLPAFGSSGIKTPSIKLQFRFTPKGLRR